MFKKSISKRSLTYAFASKTSEPVGTIIMDVLCWAQVETETTAACRCAHEAGMARALTASARLLLLLPSASLSNSLGGPMQHHC